MIPGGKSTKIKFEMLRGINLAVSMKWVQLIPGGEQSTLECFEELDIKKP